LISARFKELANALSANSEILEELINSEDEVHVPNSSPSFNFLKNHGLIEQVDVDSFVPGEVLIELSKSITNSRHDMGGIKDLDDWIKGIEGLARKYNDYFEVNDIDELKAIRRRMKQASFSLISDYRKTIRSIDADISDTLGYSKNIHQRIKENEEAIERLKGIGAKIDSLTYKRMEGVSKHPGVKYILAIDLMRKRGDLNAYLGTILTKTERLLFQQRKMDLQTKRLRKLNRFMDSGGTVDVELLVLDAESLFNKIKKTKLSVGIIPEKLGDVTELRFIDILSKIKFEKTESTRIVESPEQYLTDEVVVSEMMQFSELNSETEDAKTAFHKTITKSASSLADFWDRDEQLQEVTPKRVWLIYMSNTYKLIQEDMFLTKDKRRLEIEYTESLNSESSCISNVQDITIHLRQT
jgi:hypothetical protein